MAEQDAELLEVLIRQIGQDADVYRVLAECRLISIEAKASQPTPEVHDDAFAPANS